MITIKLRALLEDRKMSQSELARITNIRPSTISDLCNNNSCFIKLDYLNSICKAISCSIDDLLKLR